MELKPVTQDDAEYLYELLKQREGSVNISHRSTPEWETHVEYIKNNSYQAWDIILIDGNKVGNIYLTEKNEIGIFIDKRFADDPEFTKTLYLTPSHLDQVFSNCFTLLDCVKMIFFCFNNFITELTSDLLKLLCISGWKYFMLISKIPQQNITFFICKIKWNSY